MQDKNFANQRKGDEELSRLAKSVGQITTEEEFAYVQKIYDIVKNRERTSIPPMQIQKKKYRGRMLSPDDVLNIFAGNITTCCQRFGDVGEGSMLLGAIEENAGIFVIEEIGEYGKTNIVGQSLVIRQKGVEGTNDRLCFDNIEIAKSAYEKMTDEDHAEIFEIYKDVGRQSIEKDKKFLGKLLKDGKISQEIYDGLVLKEITVGQGFNDLRGLGDLPEAEVVVADEAYYRYTTIIGDKINPWVDSAGGKAPYGSRGMPVKLATMEKEDLEEILTRQERGYEASKKVKLSDVPLWYRKVGKVQCFTKETLEDEEIEKIKQIEKQAFRKAQQILNAKDIKNGKDIECAYRIKNMKINMGSNDDWYLIYGESEDEITISDLAVLGATNAENKKENENIKLATAEAVDTLYEILINTGKNGKKICCNATKDTSLINIKRMLQKGLIKTFDENGEEIIFDKKEGLVYANSREKVKYRKLRSAREIEMLDLVIEPEIEKMKKEKEKISKLLEKTRDFIRMQGREKEEGLDELRRTIRDDLEDIDK